MRISDSDAEAILDNDFGSGTPATWYFGILTAAPSNDGTGYTECSMTGYARVAMTNNTTNFPNCVAGSRTKKTGTAVAFPSLTAGGPVVGQGLGIFSSGTAGAGECRRYLPFLTGPQTFANGSAPTYPAESIQIAILP
jgi:hypothetical protein